MSIKRESNAIHALSAATTALIIAAFDLAAAERWDEARAANAAARLANESCSRACDEILSRWWVRLILRIGDWATRFNNEKDCRTNAGTKS